MSFQNKLISIFHFKNLNIMLDTVRHLHSINRWIILILLLVTIVTAFSKWSSNKEYSEQDKKLALFTLISTHLQFIIGIILLFISNKISFDEGWIKNAEYRYFGMEHMLLMIIGVILITAGYSIAKRKTDAKSKFKTIWIFFGLGLLMIVFRIPWGTHGASWY